MTKKNGIKIDIKEEMPIRDLLFMLKINADDSPMVSINGKLVWKNCMLKDNDVVEIFPVIYGDNRNARDNQLRKRGCPISENDIWNAA